VQRLLTGAISTVVGLLSSLVLTVASRWLRHDADKTAGISPAIRDAVQPSVDPPAPVPRPSTRERRAERIAVTAFILAGIAGVALFGVYVIGGQNQAEGLLLAISLGGLGTGITIWAHDLMPNTEHVEQREPLASPPSRAQGPDLSRRTLLIRSLIVGLGGLAAALALPVLSLGPSPGDSLRQTSWKRGSRLVGENGEPIKTTSLAIDSIVTVFPEGSVGVADSQAVLIRVADGLLQLPPGRMAGAPDGFVVYSKICTHAGCPVGLYRASDHRLICPCHQSTFDVLDGAAPVFGPAVRALPQLLVARGSDDGLVALGDFTAPVGPSFWDIDRGELS
jgi:ubiquinol-cytochrome c reductase iron-sulfur subunit